MRKTMYGVTLMTAAMTPFFSFLAVRNDSGPFLSLAITSGTILYHLLMRIVTGKIVAGAMKDRTDIYLRRWQTGSREMRLYTALRVKEWKKRLPTWSPEEFDIGKHSWKEIAEASCRAECVHEWIFILSYVPLLAAPFSGAFPVFLITSILASSADLTFVIIQRYNRGRIMRLLDRRKTN